MTATSVAELLAGLRQSGPSPRVTWYGDDDERVELTAAELDSWVGRTTNLLVQELGASPGTRVGLDLPGHWRSIVWALAVWRSGSCLVLGQPTAPVDIAVTNDLALAPAAERTIAVALPAGARRFGAPLPPDAIDAAAVLPDHPDEVVAETPVAPSASAIDDGERVSFEHLLAPTDGARAGRTGERVLMHAPDYLDGHSIRALLRPLVNEGSVVLASNLTTHALLEDAERRERLVAAELVTDDLLGDAHKHHSRHHGWH
ncbi:TIGR03089 family protein [Cellulomonas sp. URHD0024]|uniref:TIGR03089 family protein n=1 Tax=Cellulomonas sp. URHD0024 TaxID=1302620 RepID=UPI0003FFD493|nr:TIGR03089 family protein [Cellulomonas sp. URHD0024]